MEKIFCNKCNSDKSLEEVGKNYNLCPDCKFDLSADLEREMNLDRLERGGGMLKKISGYFQFKNMITNSIIQYLYVIGVINIIIISIGLINGSSEQYGFYLLLYGNIFWRIICEGLILFFSIHESVVSIENNTIIN